MSARIIGQIFGSIAGAGAASTGLWFGISKFWNINGSDKATSELLGEITDDVPIESLNETQEEIIAEPLAETPDSATDVQSIVPIKDNAEITQVPTVVTEIKTETITSPPQQLLV